MKHKHIHIHTNEIFIHEGGVVGLASHVHSSGLGGGGGDVVEVQPRRWAGTHEEEGGGGGGGGGGFIRIQRYYRGIEEPKGLRVGTNSRKYPL